MTKSNKALWTSVEGLAAQYSQETDEFKKQNILGDIFESMNKYINTSVNNAFSNARNYGLEIPKEDFESRFMQYLWEAIESFEIGGSTFKNIVMRRFQFAEAHTFRQYKTKGDASDKDGVSYTSARWDSLDRKAGGGEGEATLADVVLGDTDSAEQEFIGQFEETNIVKGFGKHISERYAVVIHFMALGYDGDELAILTGEADSNNAKMRKLISRAKKAFGEYMEKG